MNVSFRMLFEEIYQHLENLHELNELIFFKWPMQDVMKSWMGKYAFNGQDQLVGFDVSVC